MKRPQKFRIASFGLDMVVMAVLLHLIDAAGGGLLWGLFALAVVASSVSSVLYGEYFLLKYGPKRYGAKD